GAGTVVTGTTWSGTVATGDGVRLLPGTEQARVRSVEVHGERRERAEPGRRTALALPGVARETISRGSVVVADPGWQDSKAVDVLVTLLPDARPLSQRTRIRLHLGTSEVFARVTPATDEIVPGKTAAARLRLEQPVVARWGDRGVLRSYSPVRTIGGCVVIDPHPPRRPRRPQGLHDRAVSNPAARVARFTALSDWEGLPIRDLPVRAGVHPTEVSEVVQEARAGDIEVVSEKLFPKVLLREARRITTEALEAYHHDRPLDPGMQRELLRGLLPNPALIDYVVAALVGQGKVVVEAGAVRLSTHEPTLSDQERQWVGAMSQALEEAGPLGRTEQELGEVVPSTAVRDLAEYLVREGAAVRIGRDRFYRTEAARTLREAILEELRERGRATPAELRVKTGLTRKYLIPFLEWLDGAGFTVRDGDGRRLGPAADARDLDS
ncbi:MAG: SelB C-terminal domain-containing protein, partial [Gemmatimonadales bacterium]